MRTRAFSAGATLFLYACSGTPVFTIDPGLGDDGGGSTNGDDGGSTGARDAQSPIPDASTVSDARDASTSDALASTNDGGPTPDAVACGATTCATPQVCCVLGDGTSTCQASGAACAGGRLACDEPGDCAGGACSVHACATGAPIESCATLPPTCP